VLITATFDQDVELVFIDDGVYELVKGQVTKGIGIKNFSPRTRALEGYGRRETLCRRESLESRGLTAADLLVPVEVLELGADGRAEWPSRTSCSAFERAPMLHIVNKSPRQPAHSPVACACRKTATALLLIEDGVYAATTRSPAAESVRAAMKRVKVYAFATRPRGARVHTSVLDGVSWSTTAALSTWWPNTPLPIRGW